MEWLSPVWSGKMADLEPGRGDCRSAEDALNGEKAVTLPEFIEPNGPDDDWTRGLNARSADEDCASCAVVWVEIGGGSKALSTVDGVAAGGNPTSVCSAGGV